MKKLTAILKNCKLVDKLFGLREKEILRAIESAKDECDEIVVRAQIWYETELKKLGEEDADYGEILNNLVEAKAQIIDANATLKIIEEIEGDLNSEAEIHKD